VGITPCGLEGEGVEEGVHVVLEGAAWEGGITAIAVVAVKAIFGGAIAPPSA